MAIIDVEASRKGAKFVRTCADFGIPMLVLVDTPGFMPGSRQEAAGVISHGAELVRAFASARSPRVTVILRKAFGGAFITMNSKDLGADASFCWPQAEVGIMSSLAAVEIIHRRKLLAAGAAALRERLIRGYAEQSLSPEAAVRSGAVDAVIEPTETRERVACSLRLQGVHAPAWGGQEAQPPSDAVDRDGAGAPLQASRSAKAVTSYRLITAPEGLQP